mgnify:CR=1 FL=1
MGSLSFFVSGTPLTLAQLGPLVITLVVELPLFYASGYRLVKELGVFAGANVISNVLLCELLSSPWGQARYYELIFPAEAVVVALEFALCRYAVSTRPLKLMLVLMMTNAASLAAGIALWRLL